ncbi:uncharacterized protein CPUR_05106 [Claviceps purpurea 20.1]|uniref:LYC1 C-terminal domain-containing protein n=1 Tax=Claviceps purpurea (strain 20.1) TaxID=1111077 RepID=M1W7S1_CLAP2|nr:uncharacterized protein CPUR_05106 [Claviceps purpurea 20.1]
MTQPMTSLVLVKATPEEKTAICLRHQPHWGSSFTPEGYLRREEGLQELSLARDGGLTVWALTQNTDANDDNSNNNNNNSYNTDDAPAGRPILSSLETYRKRAIVRGTDGIVRDVTAHGVASVFTPPHHRRKGYSSKMLSLLGDELARQEAQQPGSAGFSVLFSDVGKTFYAQHQWMPFPSTHLSFSVDLSTSTSTTTSTSNTIDDHLTLITDDNLPKIAQLDEQTLRQKLSRPPQSPHTIRVALLPDLPTYEWHFARAAFQARHLFGKTPSLHGALYTPPERPHSRVWMLWNHSLSGGPDSPEKNVLNVLHLALEDHDIPDRDLVTGLEAIMGVAQAQAQEWLCAKIEMWNPDERVKELMGRATKLPSELVVRETASIASLRWYGEGGVMDVEWVDNEKFEWC